MNEEQPTVRDYKAEAQTLLFGQGVEAWKNTSNVYPGPGNEVLRCLSVEAEEDEATIPGELHDAMISALIDSGVKLRSVQHRLTQLQISVSEEDYKEKILPHILKHEGVPQTRCHSFRDPHSYGPLLRARVRAALFENGYEAWQKEPFALDPTYERERPADYFTIGDQPADPADVEMAARVIMRREAGIDAAGAYITPDGAKIVLTVPTAGYHALCEKLDAHGPGTLDKNVYQMNLFQERMGARTRTHPEPHK